MVCRICFISKKLAGNRLTSPYHRAPGLRNCVNSAIEYMHGSRTRISPHLSSSHSSTSTSTLNLNPFKIETIIPSSTSLRLNLNLPYSNSNLHLHPHPPTHYNTIYIHKPTFLFSVSLSFPRKARELSPRTIDL